MQFNSYVFILFFLPITVFTYYVANIIKPSLGKLVIIIASVVFYAMGRINKGAHSLWNVILCLG